MKGASRKAEKGKLHDRALGGLGEAVPRQAAGGQERRSAEGRGGRGLRGLGSGRRGRGLGWGRR